MSSNRVIGYECATAAPVVITEEDLRGWVINESRDQSLLRLIASWTSSPASMVVDLTGGLSGCSPELRRAEAGEALSYSFTCGEDGGAFSDFLVMGLTAALNLNEEEHISLLAAARTYYSNAVAGGVISISAMLPEKSRNLELLKSKLDEITVIPPAFGVNEPPLGGIQVDLAEVAGRYARKALAYSLITKYCSSHSPATLIVEGFEAMLPENQTRSMKYPLETAVSLLWAVKGMGVKLAARSGRPLPKELDGLFETRIVDGGDAVRVHRAGSGWKEVYLVNEIGSGGDEPLVPAGGACPEDPGATEAVLDTVERYSNVSYAGLVSFLGGRMAEARVRRAADSLLRGGQMELKGGYRGGRYLTLTERGRAMKGSSTGGAE
jgi:hypothetical protein